MVTTTRSTILQFPVASGAPPDAAASVYRVPHLSASERWRMNPGSPTSLLRYPRDSMRQYSRWLGRDPARSGALARVSPWLILAVSAGVVGASVVVLASAARSRDRAWFGQAAASAAGRIIDRVDIYRSTLRGAAALFASDDSVSAAEFAAYVARLNVQQLYPGIQGIGWSRRLASGLPGPVDERHRIEYLEPLDARNRAALGFDMYSEPVRRQAMRLSRERGGAALSGKVTLMQEIGGPRQPGFLIYLPVYAGGDFPRTRAGRRDQLIGYVYAPFRAHVFFGRVLGPEPGRRVNAAVYDGPDTSQHALLYRTSREAGHRPHYRKVDTLHIAGHHWAVVFESTPAFEARLWQSAVPYAGALGVAATLLLFVLARAVARALHAAEAANRAKNSFLATMSHELRTPLNAIIGYADLLDMGVPQPIGDQPRAQVRRIQQGAQHLLGIIEAMLLLARTEALMEAVHAETVDVHTVVNSAVDLTRPMAVAKGLELQCSFADSLQPIRTDPQKLRQILVNLIANAIKFTTTGGVRISAARNEHHVEVMVEDTGIGITPEHLPRIFEPFWQAEAGHTRRFGGTGLGLAVSRNLARLIGGDIRVESTAGAGATFIVRLPVKLP